MKYGVPSNDLLTHMRIGVLVVTERPFTLDHAAFVSRPKIDTKLDFHGVGPNRPQNIEKKAVRIAGGNVGSSGADRDFLVLRRF